MLQKSIANNHRNRQKNRKISHSRDQFLDISLNWREIWFVVFEFFGHFSRLSFVADRQNFRLGVASNHDRARQNFVATLFRDRQRFASQNRLVNFERICAQNFRISWNFVASFQLDFFAFFQLQKQNFDKFTISKNSRARLAH